MQTDKQTNINVSAEVTEVVTFVKSTKSLDDRGAAAWRPHTPGGLVAPCPFPVLSSLLQLLLSDSGAGRRCQHYFTALFITADLLSETVKVPPVELSRVSETGRVQTLEDQPAQAGRQKQADSLIFQEMSRTYKAHHC